MTRPYRLYFSFFLLVTLAFILGILFSWQKTDPAAAALKNKNCLYCHSDMEAKQILSDRASGKTKLIFYHSTHVTPKRLRCIDCHDKKNYHSTRPSMQSCLICHDNRLAANDCNVCHRQPENLDLEN